MTKITAILHRFTAEQLELALRGAGKVTDAVHQGQTEQTTQVKPNSSNRVDDMRDQKVEIHSAADGKQGPGQGPAQIFFGKELVADKEGNQTNNHQKGIDRAGALKIKNHQGAEQAAEKELDTKGEPVLPLGLYFPHQQDKNESCPKIIGGEHQEVKKGNHPAHGHRVPGKTAKKSKGRQETADGIELRFKLVHQFSRIHDQIVT